MKVHLKAHHPLNYAEWYNKQRSVEAASLGVKKAQIEKEGAAFKVPSITAHLVKEPCPIKGDKQERFDMELAKFVVMCNLPFSICDSDWFKRFVGWIDPRYTVKSWTTIGKKEVRILFGIVMEAVKKNLDEDLKEVTAMGLTIDNWQSRANEAYQSLTIRYVNKDFKLRR